MTRERLRGNIKYYTKQILITISTGIYLLLATATVMLYIKFCIWLWGKL